MILRKIEQVCYGCPSSWEAWTTEGDLLKIRYRYGSLTVHKAGECILEIDHGDGWDGILSTEEMLQLTKYEVIL